MSFAVRLYHTLERVISRVAFLFGWLMFPLLAVTIFDVVTRRFFVLGSTYLQEVEWHLHTMVFTLALGFAYVRNRHVRIDIFRAHWSERRQAWVELFGCLIFMIPFSTMLIYYGIKFAHISWVQNEISSSAMGLSHRWAIKSFIPIGGLFLLTSGIAVFTRTALYLFGPEEIRKSYREPRSSPTAGLIDGAGEDASEPSSKTI